MRLKADNQRLVLIAILSLAGHFYALSIQKHWQLGDSFGKNFIQLELIAFSAESSSSQASIQKNSAQSKKKEISLQRKNTLEKEVEKSAEIRSSFSPPRAELKRTSLGLSSTSSRGIEAGIKKAGDFHQPVCLFCPKPAYPLLAKSKGIEGVVRFLVWVDKDGEVAKIELLHSSGYKILDKKAKQTIKRWRFKPAYSLGAPIISQVLVSVRFSLDENSSNQYK